MEVLSAEFVVSNTEVEKCPATHKPEFAFIGRSNVGKSSLINKLVNRKDLAKTSATPGKTQTINHFIVNNAWYLVDLPGYGFAKVSKTSRNSWTGMIDRYFKQRENLYCTFILLDSRLEPQPIDIDFINYLGGKGLPLALALTKTDKLKQNELAANRKAIESELLKTWEFLPPIFVTSAEKGTGRKPMLDFIETALNAKR
ncbi:MAG: ribosome biogenesis GTP-binding protein YihA/YsxC [Cyclobacteriaceae bacterium]|nr:ribosome biogenesis GTP-binding protein YihA/YsxC [Cyclobacteriaceae bacterium]